MLGPVAEDLVNPLQTFRKLLSENNLGFDLAYLEHLNHLPIHLAYENSTTAIIERIPKFIDRRLLCPAWFACAYWCR